MQWERLARRTADVTRELGAVLRDVDRSLHGATALVAQDHDRDRTQLHTAVFDTPDHIRVGCGVPGDAHHEEVAQPFVVDDLGRNPRICAPQHDGVWSLTLGYRGAAPTVPAWVSEGAAHEPTVPGGETRDGLVRRERRAGCRSSSRPRRSRRTDHEASPTRRSVLRQSTPLRAAHRDVKRSSLPPPRLPGSDPKTAQHRGRGRDRRASGLVSCRMADVQ